MKNLSVFCLILLCCLACSRKKNLFDQQSILPNLPLPSVTLPVEPELTPPAPALTQKDPQCVADEIQNEKLKESKIIHINRSLINLIDEDLKRNPGIDFWNALSEGIKTRLQLAISLQFPDSEAAIPQAPYQALPLIFSLQADGPIKDITYKVNDGLAIKLNAKKSHKSVEINEICKKEIELPSGSKLAIQGFTPIKQVLGCKADENILLILKQGEKTILAINDELFILKEKEFIKKETLLAHKYSIDTEDVQLEIKISKLFKSKTSISVNTPENHFEKDGGCKRD